MTKSELIAAVATQSGVSKTEVSRVCEAIFSGVIPDKLAEGEEIAISGFGKFTSSLREARVGRNPSSGATINIAEKMVVKFKPATDLKKKIN